MVRVFGKVGSALAMAVVATSAASAQSRPRIGYAGTPKPTVTQQGERQTIPVPTVVYSTVPASAPYLVNNAPYLALNDGTVLVNFGNGYERVLRQCNGSANVSQTDRNGLDALGRIPLPLLNGGERGQVSGTMPARNESACYRIGHNRRVHIVRG